MEHIVVSSYDDLHTSKVEVIQNDCDKDKAVNTATPSGRKKVPQKSKRITFTDDHDDDRSFDTSRPRGGKEIQPPSPSPPAEKKPEWYQEMSDQQINMFKEVFEMLDKDGGGSIDSEELYSLMKELDIDVSLEEIKNVLKDLDQDGNGEIDFDEFLFCMAEGLFDPNGTRCSSSGSGTYNKRQTLFFTAITRFAIKNSLGEIERYYANKVRQAPHVISCYTAGVRLIGLNDRQLEEEIRRMQKAARKHKSPYAKPLPFVTVKPKKKRPKKKEADITSEGVPDNKSVPKSNPNSNDRHESKTRVESNTNFESEAKLNTETQAKLNTETQAKLNTETQAKIETETASSLCTPEARLKSNSMPDIKKTESQSVSASCMLEEALSDTDSCFIVRPRARHVAEEDPDDGCTSVPSRIRRAALTLDDMEVLSNLQNLKEKGNVVAKIPDIHLVPQIRTKLASGDINEPICSSVRKRRRTLMEMGNQNKPNSHKKHGKGVEPGPRGWMIPRTERGQAPMPVIKLSDGNIQKTFTIEDVPDIRKWVSESLDVYYSTLKKAHVKTAISHWKQLHTDQIKSKRLQDLFLKVYRAYSPHEEEEVFAISPWIPGRWCFKRTSNNSNGSTSAAQEQLIGSCYSTSTSPYAVSRGPGRQPISRRPGVWIPPNRPVSTGTTKQTNTTRSRAATAGSRDASAGSRATTAGSRAASTNICHGTKGTRCSTPDTTHVRFNSMVKTHSLNIARPFSR